MKKRIKLEKIIESNNNNNNNNNADDYYIAVDIGKKNCIVCVTNKDGSILEETKCDNALPKTEERFAFYLDNKYDNSRKCHAVCETTANM
jgi:hypothetical protein